MKAAQQFILSLHNKHSLSDVKRLQIDLYGSLALTGKGHGTDKAILLGLEGHGPDTVDPQWVAPRFQQIMQQQKLYLVGKHEIDFLAETDLLLHQRETLLHHTNGMRFTAFNDKHILATQVFYSIGGGFIATEEELANPSHHQQETVPYPFNTAQELLNLAQQHKLSIAEIMLANEICFARKEQVITRILQIANTMLDCIEAGCHHSGILPGGLNVKRRAPNLLAKLTARGALSSGKHMDVMNCLNLFALAVNEENAAGGRVVTAPTNGAAGVLPAVLKYFLTFHPNRGDEQIVEFLLTAAAIAILYKKGASISAAEVGCQGEVGVACSMAAGALTAVLGGTIEQVENAAEIGMEHHLGLTCDPIQGLVQIPCIERNAMGAVQAVNAAHLALMEEGHHKVSLDSVIATMLQTGRDMMTQYKETALGGLAVNVPEC